MDEWAGLGNYEVADAIKAMRPEGDRYATISIGPAGEALARAAGIAVSDTKGYPNRFAGRGGLGAVMGSKGLKAIVDLRQGRPPARGRRQGSVHRREPQVHERA